ncbi:MAG: uroporphyrinogen-III C-methyltransferase [Leptospirales bacterium]
MEKKSKKVYLIGAGPGDPELITLKAIRAIEESEAILYDHLVNPKILEHARPDTKLIYVGKKKGHHSVPQEEINQMLVEQANKYSCVGRLKGGDPFIFGRGGEEVEFLARHGFSIEVIPGITSASGAGSNILLPLTHRKYGSEVVFITGHKKKDGDYNQFTAYDLTNKTMIIYMGLTAIGSIQKELCKRENNCNLPVAIIEKATLPEERVVRGKLLSIEKLIEKEKIQAPALIIIGEVVSFLDEIDKIKKEVAQIIHE